MQREKAERGKEGEGRYRGRGVRRIEDGGMRDTGEEEAITYSENRPNCTRPRSYGSPHCRDAGAKRAIPNPRLHFPSRRPIKEAAADRAGVKKPPWVRREEKKEERKSGREGGGGGGEKAGGTRRGSVGDTTTTAK